MAVVFWYTLVPFPTGSARVFALLFFGAVALLFIIGIVAQFVRPQFLRRVGATEVTTEA
jgi:hypothetical protein